MATSSDLSPDHSSFLRVVKEASTPPASEQETVEDVRHQFCSGYAKS